MLHFRVPSISRIAAAGLLALPFAAACRKERTPDAAVARVGNAIITESEFHKKLSEVTPEYQNYVITPHGRRQFLDVLIREKMILQAARKDGIASSPEFKDRMLQARREAEERLSQAKEYLMVRLWMEKLRKDGVLQVTEDEMKTFHRENPVEVKGRHILLATPEEAQRLLRRARQSGRFAALAKKYSLDADTAGDGGRLRPAIHGELIPELEALFKMKTGEIGGPIRSKFGYHVLLKEGGRKIPLAAAKERIRNVLEKGKLDRHLESLQSSISVEVIDAQFR